jgi:DNA-directed RNA polymerase subunit RPC12/RpoP
MASKMTSWRCPKCYDEIKALATSVGHRCPNNKSKFTEWEIVEEN